MNKLLITFFILLISFSLLSKSPSFAHADNNLKADSSVKVDDFNVFNISDKGEEKTQLRIKNENPDNQFMIKGVIQSSSSSSLNINGQAINLDTSVTGNIIITGNVANGNYAMVKGIIKNSTWYAERIVVDQRNKKELEENDETPSVTPTISPSVTLTPTPTGTESAGINEKDNSNANLDLGNIITSVENFLNYLKDLAQKI